MSNGLESALALAQRGFRVFPLQENGTTPAIKDWPTRATTDPDRIKELWTDPIGETLNYNPAIATGEGVLVLDFDCKDNKPGVSYLGVWDAVGEVPESLRTTTPSGGKHLILACESDVANSVGKLAPGVDIRGRHGYIVGPGSTTAKGSYAWENGSAMKSLADIEPAPNWIIEKAGRPRERKESDSVSLVDLDDESAVTAARDWLKDHAPEAIEGAGGDRTTYEVAAKIKDFGVSPGIALELMLEHWNEQRASPPWMPHELEAKIENAYAYGTSPPGVSSARGEFEPVVLESVATKEMYLVPHKDARHKALTASAEPLIKGFLDQGTFSVLYGAANVGKTFVALDIAYAIATGQTWNEKKSTRGGVVYVSAEGGGGIYKRIEAIAREKGIPDRTPVSIIPCPVNMHSNRKDIETLIALAGEAATLHGVPTKLIVIDTVSRVLSGGDENSSVDMGALVKNLDRLREATGAHVMGIHHSGKDQTRGARGHSLLRAAADTEIEIADGTVRIAKQRDLDPMRPVVFRLQRVNVGKDADGDQVTTCVVDIVTGTEFEPLPLNAQEQDMWEAFKAAAKEKSNSENWRQSVIATSDWVSHFVIICGGEKRHAGLVKERRMRQLRQKVAMAGYVKKVGHNQWVAV